jgi:cholesterol transport system auxiliary component
MKLRPWLALLALGLAGCAGSLLESDVEAPEGYRLQGQALPDRGERLSLALGVARPRASAALETDRIAVVRADRRFEYYAGVRWAEPAPQMLQQSLVRGLSADGRFAVVLAAPSRVPADLLLDVELRRFEAVHAAADDAPEVHVELLVTVVDAGRAGRVTSFAVATAERAGDYRRAEVVAAFDRATAEAVRTVADRLRETVRPPALTRPGTP